MAAGPEEVLDSVDWSGGQIEKIGGGAADGGAACGDFGEAVSHGKVGAQCEWLDLSSGMNEINRKLKGAKPDTHRLANYYNIMNSLQFSKFFTFTSSYSYAHLVIPTLFK